MSGKRNIMLGVALNNPKKRTFGENKTPCIGFDLKFKDTKGKVDIYRIGTFRNLSRSIARCRLKGREVLIIGWPGQNPNDSREFFAEHIHIGDPVGLNQP